MVSVRGSVPGGNCTVMINSTHINDSQDFTLEITNATTLGDIRRAITENAQHIPYDLQRLTIGEDPVCAVIPDGIPFLELLKAFSNYSVGRDCILVNVTSSPEVDVTSAYWKKNTDIDAVRRMAIILSHVRSILLGSSLEAKRHEVRAVAVLAGSDIEAIRAIARDADAAIFRFLNPFPEESKKPDEDEKMPDAPGGPVRVVNPSPVDLKHAKDDKHVKDKKLLHIPTVEEELLEMKPSEFATHIFSQGPIKDKAIKRAILRNDALFAKLNDDALCRFVRKHWNDQEVIQRVLLKYSDEKQEPDLLKRRENIVRLHNTVNRMIDPHPKAEVAVNIKREYVKKLLNDYINKRAAEREYKTTFLCMKFGFSRTVKLYAAHAFLLILQQDRITVEDWQRLNDQYKRALKQSDLGRVLAECNALLKSEIYSHNDELRQEYRNRGFR